MDVIEQRSRQEAELQASIDGWIARQPAESDEKLALLVLELKGAARLRSHPKAGQYGDTLLRELYSRISSILRPADRITILSDSELLLTLFGIKNAGHARLAVRKILHEIDRFHASYAGSIHITPRLGISLWPSEASSGKELLRTAALAIDHAWSSGEPFFFYSAEDGQKQLFSWNIDGEIERALKEDQLLLHYQPQVSIASGATIGAEALIHWNHPIHGRLSPASFITLVENAEAIHPLTRWCLHSALRQLSEWTAMRIPPTVSVNISSHNFSDPSFLDMVHNALSVWGVPPQLLTLEITEGVLLDDLDFAVDLLQALHRMGVRTSIDDFGTGYSSLAYLKKLPVDELKIDQSFIRNILHDQADRSIVETIIKIAHDFRFSVVAEGIEQIEVIPLLDELGCGVGQGYAIARPMAGCEFQQWMEQCATAKR